MAYQPIQMPGRPAMFDAMDQLGQTLGRRRQEAHQADLEAEAKQRQAKLDFQQVFMQAKKLADSGDLPSAQALLADYHATVDDGGAPAAPAGGKPLQGGSPLPDSMEFPGGKRPGPGPAQPSSPPPAGPNADERAAILGQMAPPTETVPDNPNPIMAARQAQQAGNKQRAHQVLSFTAPGGQRMSIDPEASRAAQGEQKAARLDSAFAGVQDPEVQQIYQRMRPILMSSTQDVDPSDVFKYIQSVQSDKQRTELEDRREKERAAHAAEAEANTERRDLRHDARSDENSRRMLEGLLARMAIQNDPNIKPLSEGEKKAAAAGDRLKLLSTELDKMQPLSQEERQTILTDAANAEYLDKHPAVNAAGTALGAVKPVTEKLTPEGRAYYNQLREIGSVILRKESGAAISQQEWQDIFARYAPSAGDTAEDLAQKRRNRQLAIQAIAAEGVRALPGQVPGTAVPGTTAPAHPVAAARAAHRDRNKARAGEVKRGGKGTAPVNTADYLDMLK